MSIKIENDEEKTSLYIDGELTIYTAQEYREAIIGSFSADKNLELDMADVEEIDTSGLQLLAALSKELVENGSEMKILSASDVATDAIQASCLMTGLMVDLKADVQGDLS